MTGKYPYAPKIQVPVVDVRDVADAHVNAIERGVGGTRYLLNCRDNFIPFLEMGTVLHEEFKDKGYKIPTKEAPYCLIWLASVCDRRVKPLLPQWGKKFAVDRKKSLDELGLNYISLEQSLTQMTHNLIDLGYIEDKRNSS